MIYVRFIAGTHLKTGLWLEWHGAVRLHRKNNDTMEYISGAGVRCHCQSQVKKRKQIILDRQIALETKSERAKHLNSILYSDLFVRFKSHTSHQLFFSHFEVHSTSTISTKNHLTFFCDFHQFQSNFFFYLVWRQSVCLMRFWFINAKGLVAMLSHSTWLMHSTLVRFAFQKMSDFKCSYQVPHCTNYFH